MAKGGEYVVIKRLDLESVLKEIKALKKIVLERSGERRQSSQASEASR